MVKLLAVTLALLAFLPGVATALVLDVALPPDVLPTAAPGAPAAGDGRGRELPSPPSLEEDPLPATPGELVDEALARSTELVFTLTGNNVTREDVRVYMDMDFRSLDIDLWGVLFGGGKFEAQARVTTRVEFRALSIGRLQEALAGATGGIVNLSQVGINSDQMYVTADQFRTLLAGDAASLLFALQSEQEDRIAELLQASFPELTVLSTRFSWKNVQPLDSFANGVNVQQAISDLQATALNDIKEPPIVVEAVIDLQYLKRRSAVDFLDAWRASRQSDDEGGGGVEKPPEETLNPREQLLERLKSENEGAFYERSAFSVLGITQLLVLRMEPGWDLVVTMALPEGYTFEYASPDVQVDDARRAATVMTLARDSSLPIENPAAVSLSNRFLVTVALLAAVLLVGAVLRLPVLLAANAVRKRRFLLFDDE